MGYVNTHMHQYYTSAIVDPQAMKDQAQRALDKRGEESIVHMHRYGEPCMGKCIGYYIKNEANDVR